MSEINFSFFVFGILFFLHNAVCAPQQKHTKVGQTQVQQSYLPVIPVEMGKMEYNASVDAVALYDALIGLGTNDRVVVDIIPNRSQNQRKLIREAYTKIYQKDLIEDLKADLSGNYGNVIIALMRDPYELQAKELHRALTSILSSDDHVVGSILATITKPDILALKHTYGTLFNVTLEDDILSYSEGEFKSFLYKIVASAVSVSPFYHTFPVWRDGGFISFLNKIVTSVVSALIIKYPYYSICDTLREKAPKVGQDGFELKTF